MSHLEATSGAPLSAKRAAGIERSVHHSMRDNIIEAIPIYPEHRLAYHPTTVKIADRFQEMSVSRLMQDNKLVNEFRDLLNDIQLSMLSLLGMSETDYWKSIK